MLRVVNRAPLKLYDWGLGWVYGHRFLRLSHRGRRSGRRYETMLEVVGWDRSTGEVMVISGFGPGSDWFRNLQAHPALEICVGHERFVPRQRFLGEDEAVVALAAYEQQHRYARVALRRLFERTFGRPYDVSDDARRELVRRLPMVAFAPAGGSADTGRRLR
ncbi:MAG TPA: nitroreductase family deazaflavin-dependent oxidoreductase [Microlunatus sp.]|nr:nitroreductase family deazaflavin-dependent oxidoreductase [Microlunatus sp.]